MTNIIKVTSAKKEDVKKSKINLQKPAKVEVKADKANVEQAAQKIQYERILKWKYPEDCISAKDRKVFRALNRGKIRRAEAHALKTDNAKEKAALISQAKELRKAVLMDAEAEV